VIVPSTGVIVVELMVPMPQSVMVGAVLGATVEPFLVCALMPSRGPIMESLVPRMIAGVPVIIVMSEAGCRRNTQDQNGSRQ
jgi:hypothetical protein